MPLRLRLAQTASGCAVCLFALAGWYSIRLAYADRLFHASSATALKRAARIAPGNAEYQARWAGLLDTAVSDREIAAHLATATALDPWLSSAWIARGLRAERDGDFDTARSYLVRAATTVDRTYNPLWTLTNFYFRRNDTDRFWLSARKALTIADPRYYDLTPLFQLCRLMSEDSQAILELALPNNRDTQRSYFTFLLARDRLTEAAAVANRILNTADDEDLPPLLSYCDRLIDTSNIQTALHVWNSLCRKRLLPFQALDPERGASLTNGDFRISLVSRGFDWHLLSVPQVSSQRMEPPAVRFEFGGNQPERCELLTQVVPLLAGHRYRLRFLYQTDRIPPQSGLRWQIYNSSTGAALPSESPFLSSGRKTEGSVIFSTYSTPTLARLALAYERMPATTRLEGSLTLSEVTLELDQ